MDENNYGYEMDYQLYDDYPPEFVERKNVPGLLGMIFGIIGCVLSVACGWYPAFIVWPAMFDIAALVLSIIGLTRKGCPTEKAKVGLILSIVGTVILILVFILFVCVIGLVTMGSVISLPTN